MIGAITKLGHESRSGRAVACVSRGHNRSGERNVDWTSLVWHRSCSCTNDPQELVLVWQLSPASRGEACRPQLSASSIRYYTGHNVEYAPPRANVYGLLRYHRGPQAASPLCLGVLPCQINDKVKVGITWKGRKENETEAEEHL